MCGITGIINFNGLTKNNIKSVKKAARLQIHRGPDHTGRYYDKNVYLINDKNSVFYNYINFTIYYILLYVFKRQN